MRYFLRRGTEEYGPYTLADLRRFALSGNVAPSDEVRAETDSVWQPARLALGDEAWPAPPTGPATGYPTGPATGYPAGPATGHAAGPAQAGFGAEPYPPAGQSFQPPPGAYLPAYQVPTMANGAPLPNDLHWGWLLLLTTVSCGFVAIVWILMQAWWVRKLDPRSKAIWYLVTYLVISYGAIIPNLSGAFMQELNKPEIGLVLSLLAIMMSLGSIVFYFVAVFSMRSSMEEYFQSVENIGLRLGPFLTFFCGVYYFQYHMTRIARWKKTGILA
jgi:hypothetical protein